MHVAILVNGRRPIGYAMTNARNVHGSSVGPAFSRVLYNDDERSIHAEARVAQRARIPLVANTAKARRNAARKTKHFGVATGVVVARFTLSGRLANSLPCRNCVEVMARCGFKFVVYSTTTGRFAKASISSLLESRDVRPTQTRQRAVCRRAASLSPPPLSRAHAAVNTSSVRSGGGGGGGTASARTRRAPRSPPSPAASSTSRVRAKASTPTAHATPSRASVPHVVVSSGRRSASPPRTALLRALSTPASSAVLSSTSSSSSSSSSSTSSSSTSASPIAQSLSAPASPAPDARSLLGDEIALPALADSPSSSASSSSSSPR